MYPRALEFGLREAKELLHLLRTRSRSRRNLGGTLRPVEKDLRDRMTIEQSMIALVEVGEEALVASSFAAFAGASGLREVGARTRVEVQQLERLPGHLGERMGILSKLAEHAGATFRRLV